MVIRVLMRNGMSLGSSCVLLLDTSSSSSDNAASMVAVVLLSNCTICERTMQAIRQASYPCKLSVRYMLKPHIETKRTAMYSYL